MQPVLPPDPLVLFKVFDQERFTEGGHSAGDPFSTMDPDPVHQAFDGPLSGGQEQIFGLLVDQHQGPLFSLEQAGGLIKDPPQQQGIILDGRYGPGQLRECGEPVKFTEQFLSKMIVLDGKGGLTAECGDDMHVACFEFAVRDAEDPVKLTQYDDREKIEDAPVLEEPGIGHCRRISRRYEWFAVKEALYDAARITETDGLVTVPRKAGQTHISPPLPVTDEHRATAGIYQRGQLPQQTPVQRLGLFSGRRTPSVDELFQAFEVIPGGGVLIAAQQPANRIGRKITDYPGFRTTRKRSGRG
jgi:hypothetical protein